MIITTSSSHHDYLFSFNTLNQIKYVTEAFTWPWVNKVAYQEHVNSQTQQDECPHDDKWLVVVAIVDSEYEKTEKSNCVWDDTWPEDAINKI